MMMVTGTASMTDPKDAARAPANDLRPGDSADNTLTADLRADLVRIVARFQAPEGGVMMTLQGVRIEPCPLGGAILAATDGNRLLVVRDATGRVSRPATVRFPALLLGKVRDLIRFQRRADADDGAGVRIAIADERVRVPGIALEGILEEIGHPFPMWRGAIPSPVGERRTTALAALAPLPAHAELIGATAAALAQALRPSGEESLTLHATTTDHLLLASFGEGVDAFAVLTAGPDLTRWSRPLWTMGQAPRKAAT